MRKQLSRCNLCGQCNSVAQDYLMTKDEILSPRFKAWQLREEKESNILFVSTLNPAIDKACPANIPLTFWIRKGRALQVQKGLEPQSIKDFRDKFLEKKSL